MLFTSKLKLNEELSVSNNVIELTDIISNKILIALKFIKPEMSREYYRIFKKGTIDIATEGLIPSLDRLTIYFHVYLFDDIDDYKMHKITLDTNCSADFENHSMMLRLVTINGMPDSNFNSSIQHEVNHIFQYANGATKNVLLYNKLIEITKDKASTRKDRIIAYALCLTFPTEQDSFANQYYAYLKQNNIDWDIVYDEFSEDDNNPYSRILDVYDAIDTLHLDDTYMNEKFGMNVKQFFMRLENADKRLRRKLIKAASRWRQDAKNESYTYSKDLGIFKDSKRMNFIMECYKKGITAESSEYDD